jgi:uncharacterized protein (TIGR02646 family)
MFNIKRLNSPVSIDIQKDKSHQFGDAKALNPNHNFVWATISGQKFNYICRPILLGMTENHCAFCDLNDLGPGARFTIDHHRPKSAHPRLSHMWINLYPSCDNCQQAKSETTNKHALRPDEANYNFTRYFTVDARTGEIEVRPNLSQEMDIRANETLSFYGLNDFGRQSARKTELKKMNIILGGDNPDGLALNDFSYRFMWY